MDRVGQNRDFVSLLASLLGECGLGVDGAETRQSAPRPHEPLATRRVFKDGITFLEPDDHNRRPLPIWRDRKIERPGALRLH